VGISHESYHVPWRYSLTPTRAVAVFLLLLVIPVSVFQALKLWFHGEKSQFPDIDAACRPARRRFANRELPGRQPLYLVLGSTGEEQERALFEAAKAASHRAGSSRRDQRALHWYVSADRIFLSCTGASWLSAHCRLSWRGAESSLD